jgi:hypothetical protein
MVMPRKKLPENFVGVVSRSDLSLSKKAKILKMARDTVGRLAEVNNIPINQKDGSIYKRKKIDRRTSTSLCWTCSLAVPWGACCWPEKEVPGAVIKYTEVKDEYKTMQLGTVIFCPNYINTDSSTKKRR